MQCWWLQWCWSFIVVHVAFNSSNQVNTESQQVFALVDHKALYSCLHISPYFSFLTLVPSLSRICARAYTHTHTHTHTHTPPLSLSYNSIYTGHLRITQVSNPCNIIIFIPLTIRSSSHMQTHSHIRIQLTIRSNVF